MSHRGTLRLLAGAAVALALVALPSLAHADGAGSLAEVTGFGANPGALKMFLYTPPTPAAQPGLVFVLHGCTSSPADFRKAGWEAIADEHGFYVVYPGTTSSNNPAMCFNWAGDWGNFTPLERGMDENQSIVSMAQHMQSRLGVAGDRIFATGHSSGAAMVVVLLATWPDVFEAGATIAGIPYKCPGSYGEVFSCMSPGKNLDGATWGDRARSGYPGYTGAYPRLAVWHGANDFTVATLNQTELVEQWTALHGIDATPDAEGDVDGAVHKVYGAAGGRGIVESYTVPGAGHVVFVDPGAGCGATGAYFGDFGVCSTRHIADFFGLTEVAPTGGGDTGGGDTSGGDTSGGGDTGGGDTSGGDTSGGDTSGGGDTGGGGGDTSGGGGDTSGGGGDTSGGGGDTSGTSGGTDTSGTSGGPTDTSGTSGGAETSGGGVIIIQGGDTAHDCTDEVASLGCHSGAASTGLAGLVGLLLLGLAAAARRRRVVPRALTVAAATLSLSACDIGVGGASPEPCDNDATAHADGVLVPGDAAVTDPRVPACAQRVDQVAAQVSGLLGGYSPADAPEMIGAGSQLLDADYAGKYRDDLANHPGCKPRALYGPNTSEPFSTDNDAAGVPGQPADIPDYPCAAKAYTQPAPDTSKPIVILFHGNSSGATAWEPYLNGAIAGTSQQNLAGFAFLVDATPRDQLAERLVASGYDVVAFDARTDLVATLGDWDSASETGNPFLNTDHGWHVPMAQALIGAVIQDNPGREVSLVGHSLGVTVIRDALRRLWVAWRRGDAGAVNPFPHIRDVVLLSGANHGVSTGPLCNVFPHMRGKVCCEMGDRGAYVETWFHRPLNGPRDLWSAPCADGSYAFGARDQCGGHAVQYTTVTMVDIANGEYQDEFVSEESSRLDLAPCVDNVLISIDAYDASGYFFTGRPGFLASHFGSARSQAGLDLILQKLGD